MGTKYNGSDEEKVALDLFIKLNRAGDSVNRRMLSRLHSSNLTIAQFGVLDALYHLGALTHGELAKKHLRSPNNMTSVIDTMERSGLVTRHRSIEDRRVILVELTEKGRSLFEEVWPGHLSAILDSMNTLEPQEQCQLARLLKKLGTGLN